MPLPPQPVFLLGAGASQEAGIATTYDLTEQLVGRIGASQGQRQMAAALHFVCGALLAYDGAAGKDPFGGLDVERVFAAVELLAERRSLEVTPFVSAWHPAVDAWDMRKRSGHASASFDHRFRRALEGERRQGEAGRMIRDLINETQATSATGKTYALLAAQMLAELRDLVATSHKKLDYLEPLVQAGRRDGGLTVATLNYDLSVEQAAQASEVPLTTGIEDWLEQGRWEWAESGISLLKLHGSIDWSWDESHGSNGDLPRKVVALSDDPAEERRPPALVFGQRGKLRAEGPFLGLLAEFETKLSEALNLVTVGYSFRDDHVNEVIKRWLADDVGRKILVVDPVWPDTPGGSNPDFRQLMNRHLVPNPLPHAEAEFEPRLEVWRMKCSEALRQLG